jgi:hypothetical protein
MPQHGLASEREFDRKPERTSNTAIGLVSRALGPPQRDRVLSNSASPQRRTIPKAPATRQTTCPRVEQCHGELRRCCP